MIAARGRPLCPALLLPLLLAALCPAAAAEGGSAPTGSGGAGGGGGTRRGVVRGAPGFGAQLCGERTGWGSGAGGPLGLCG